MTKRKFHPETDSLFWSLSPKRFVKLGKRGHRTPFPEAAPEPVAERKVELRPRHWRLNRPGEAANVVGRTEPSAPGYETRADAIASDDDFEEYKGEALDLAGFFQCIASPKGEYGLLSEVRAAEFV